jgi:hypothetical protein
MRLEDRSVAPPPRLIRLNQPPKRSLEVGPFAGREDGDERKRGRLSVYLPEASEAREQELRLVECDVGLLEGVSGGPASGPLLERWAVLLGCHHDELGRVDQ